MNEADDPNRRIAELEAQVRALRAEVDALRTDGEGDAPRYPDEVGLAERAELVSLGDAVQAHHAYPEPVMLETRIGTVWLSRMAGLLLMSALIVGLMQTVQSEALGRWNKLGVVYGVSLAGLVFGVLARRSSNPLPKTIMGCALAGLYYATYAACFVPGVQVFPDRWIALPLLFALLALIAVTTVWRGSKTVAGITLFLVYYTAVAAGARGGSMDAILYALGSGTACAAMGLYFVFYFRWVMFGWMSVIGLYGTFAYFFWSQPASWTLSSEAFAAAISAALSVNFIVLTAAIVLEARLRSSRRLMLPVLAMLNTALFYGVMWRHLAGDLATYRPLVHAGVTVVLALAALASETSGPSRNRLFPTLLTLAGFALTFAFGSYFSGPLLPVALAAESLLLASAYLLSGVVAVKLLGLGVLAAAGFLGIAAYQLPGAVHVFGTAVPAAWFAGGGTAALMLVAAWYYAASGAPRQPHERRLSGHWFLADSLWDLPQASCSMLHAGAAGIVLLAASIFEFGPTPYGPYAAAGIGAAMALTGLLLGTAQIAAAAAAPLVGAHILWHVALWSGQSTMPMAPPWLGATALLLLFTFAGGMAWEYYALRDRRGPAWEKGLVAGAPYVIGAYTFVVVLEYHVAAPWTAAVIAGTGVLLAAAGRFRPLRGLQSAGVLTATYGTIVYAGPALAAPLAPIVDRGVLAMGAALFFALILSERALTRTGLSKWSALLLVMNAALAAAAGLIHAAGWAMAPLVTTGLAVALLAAGAFLPSRAYRSAALAVFTASAALAVFAPEGWRLLTLSVLGAVILAVSGLYARFRLAQWPSARGAKPSRLGHER